MLAQGKDIDEILSSMKMIAEGVETVKSIVKFQKDLDIVLPISTMVYDVIYNKTSALEGMKSLMVRPLKSELI
jgi:glycerol-3-phosphate dehydrogenase (NAD(P)+)